MTIPTRSPPTPRRRSAGPTGSSRGGSPRPSSSTGSSGRPPPRRSGATAGSASSTSTVPPVTAGELGEPGVEPAPGGGPIAAEAGERAGLIVVRNGRVVHHELDAALEAKGVTVCGIATCELESDRGVARHVLRRVARRVHGAARRLPRRRRVHPGARRGRRRRADRGAALVARATGSPASRTRCVVAEEGAEVTVVERYGSPDIAGRPATSSTPSSSSSSVTTRTCGTSRCRSTGRAPGRVALQRRAPRSRRIAAVVGGRARRRLRPAAERVAARRVRAPRAISLAVYFGDGTQMLDFRTLQDHDAPHTRSDLLFKGAVEDNARSVYSGLDPASGRAAQKSDAYQTNRNLVLTEGAEAESIPNLEIEADDVKCSHASTVGPIDDDQLYYLATPRRAARGGGAAHRARLLRRRVRPPPGAVARRAAAAQRGREDRAPRPIARAC